MTFSSVPYLDLKFKFDIELFLDFLLYDIYKPCNVTAFAILFGQYEIGVFFTYLCAADD